MQKKIMKAGRVVILLAGRRAGKKAVIVKAYDEGNKKSGKQFPHALVAGVERAPMKVHKRMKKEKVEKRSRVKPFVKYVNYNHIMPTRYTLPSEIDVKQWVPESAMDNLETKKDARKQLKFLLQEKFQTPVKDKTGKVSKDMLYFSKKLRF